MLASTIGRQLRCLHPPSPLHSPPPFPRFSSILSHPLSSFSPPSRSKLFVAGFDWNLDERSILDAFSSFGEVTDVRILYDRGSGRSRGFGFVQFKMERDAKLAKDAMNGKAMLGRPLRVDFAAEKVRGTQVIIPRLFSGKKESR